MRSDAECSRFQGSRSRVLHWSCEREQARSNLAGGTRPSDGHRVSAFALWGRGERPGSPGRALRGRGDPPGPGRRARPDRGPSPVGRGRAVSRTEDLLHAALVAVSELHLHADVPDELKDQARDLVRAIGRHLSDTDRQRRARTRARARRQLAAARTDFRGRRAALAREESASAASSKAPSTEDA